MYLDLRLSARQLNNPFGVDSHRRRSGHSAPMAHAGKPLHLNLREYKLYVADAQVRGVDHSIPTLLTRNGQVRDGLNVDDIALILGMNPAWRVVAA